MTLAAFTVRAQPQGGGVRTFRKDAADTTEYAVDWTDVLDTGDSVSGAATWTIDGPDSVLTKSSQSEATPIVRAKFTAGTNDYNYLIHCTVGTTLGLNYRRSFTIQVRRPV